MSPSVGPAPRAKERQAAGSAGFDVTLQRKVVASQRKMDLATFRLNRMHDASSNTTKAREDLDTVIKDLGGFVLLVADPAHF